MKNDRRYDGKELQTMRFTLKDELSGLSGAAARNVRVRLNPGPGIAVTKAYGYPMSETPGHRDPGGHSPRRA